MKLLIYFVRPIFFFSISKINFSKKKVVRQILSHLVQFLTIGRKRLSARLRKVLVKTFKNIFHFED